MLDIAVKSKDKRMILITYEIVEKDDFSWDGFANEADEWDKLVDEANDILYS